MCVHVHCSTFPRLHPQCITYVTGSLHTKDGTHTHDITNARTDIVRPVTTIFGTVGGVIFQVQA